MMCLNMCINKLLLMLFYGVQVYLMIFWQKNWVNFDFVKSSKIGPERHHRWERSSISKLQQQLVCFIVGNFKDYNFASNVLCLSKNGDRKMATESSDVANLNLAYPYHTNQFYIKKSISCKLMQAETPLFVAECYLTGGKIKFLKQNLIPIT